MKTKRILTVLIALALLVTVLCACTPEKDPDDPKNDLAAESFFSAYVGIKDAKTVKQVITVSKDGEELAKTETNYDLTTGKATFTRNELGKDAQTGEKNFDKADIASVIKAENLTGIELNATAKTLKGSMSAENAKTLLGLEGAKNVTCLFALNDDLSLKSLTVEYTSANGNAVKIVTTCAF